MGKAKEKIKVPFHPIVIPVFSLIFTFLVGGIIAGINWTRLSKPQWKYPTIGITTVISVVIMILYKHMPVFLYNYAVYIIYSVFTGLGIVLYMIQKPYYNIWNQNKA